MVIPKFIVGLIDLFVIIGTRYCKKMSADVGKEKKIPKKMPNIS